MTTLRRFARVLAVLAAIAPGILGCATTDGGSGKPEVHAIPTAADLATIRELTQGRWWQTVNSHTEAPWNEPDYRLTLSDAMRRNRSYFVFRADGLRVVQSEIAARDYTEFGSVHLKGETILTHDGDLTQFVDGRRVSKPGKRYPPGSTAGWMPCPTSGFLSEDGRRLTIADSMPDYVSMGGTRVYEREPE